MDIDDLERSRKELQAKYHGEQRARVELRLIRSQLEHGLMSSEEAAREYGTISARLPVVLPTYDDAIKQRNEFNTAVNNYPLQYVLARSGLTMEGVIVALMKDRERLISLIQEAQWPINTGLETGAESGPKPG